jgi:hypothetical protein
MSKNQFFQNVGIRCLLASGYYGISSSKGFNSVSFSKIGYLAIRFPAITSISFNSNAVCIHCGNHSFTFWLGIAEVHYSIY